MGGGGLGKGERSDRRASEAITRAATIVPMRFPRSAGVLLHPTCLPSPYGIGDLGPEAIAYVDWLADAGIAWWQVLPLHPPGPGFSPYSAVSTFAGSDQLISPDLLVDDQLLSEEDVLDPPAFDTHRVEYEAVGHWKRQLLWSAYTRFLASPPRGIESELQEFSEQHRWWLEDYAVFAALKAKYAGSDFRSWPEALAMKRDGAIATWKKDKQKEIGFEVFCQMLFFRQLVRLRRHARNRGVGIIGDVPIFVAQDAAEVWAHPEVFLLDKNRRQKVVAGVPPDYFSETGQLWGNPLYDWKRLKSDGYKWWLQRFDHEMMMADAVRLDHFRGFAAHWEVDANAESAIDGKWVEGPGEELFLAAKDRLGGLPFIAEDLGFITEDVHELRRGLGLPGMAILHFAFAPHDRSVYIPYFHERNQVVYTGTHDNNTTIGWFLEDAEEEEKDLVRRYSGTDGSEVNWDLCRLAMASIADLAIVPHQDLAGLGADCRMNTPGQATGNWRFRLVPWMLEDRIKHRLADLVWTYGRWPIR